MLLNRAELFGHRFDLQVRLAIVGNIQLTIPDDLIPFITVGPRRWWVGIDEPPTMFLLSLFPDSMSSYLLVLGLSMFSTIMMCIHFVG